MIAASSTEPTSWRRWLSVKIALCVLGMLLLSGCGRAAYERRLEQTVALGRYREKLDDNLSYEWSQKGVKLRVPRQFREIKDDREEPDENSDNPQEPGPDPRQPPFMPTPLPGIIGAWRAEVDLIEPEGKSWAYIYALSNYDMWTQEGKAEEALKFNESIAPIAVIDGMRAKLPEAEEWVGESHPRKGGYLPTDRLTAALLKSNIGYPFLPAASSAGDDAGGNANGSDDKPEPAPQTVDMEVHCKVYLAENKDMKVTLVFIVPAKVADEEKLSLDTAKERTSRFAMSLDTLSVSSNKPKRTKPKGEGGDDKPSGGSAVGF